MQTRTISREYTIKKEDVEKLFHVKGDRELKEQLKQIPIQEERSEEEIVELNQICIPYTEFESLEAYKKRKDKILQWTKNRTQRELQLILSQVIRIMYKSDPVYREWLQQTQEKIRTFCEGTNVSTMEMTIRELIDMGWDPFLMHETIEPDATDAEKRRVIEYLYHRWMQFRDMDQIKNELMQLFRTGYCRIGMILTYVENLVSDVPEQEKFITKRRLLLEQIGYLVCYNDDVFQWYEKLGMKKPNHVTSMHAPFNDAMTTWQERVERDIHLDTKPIHGSDPYQNEGFNQLRRNLMEENRKPVDYREKREELFQHYLGEASHTNTTDTQKGRTTMKKSNNTNMTEQELLNKLMGGTMKEDRIDVSSFTLDQLASIMSSSLTKRGLDYINDHMEQYTVAHQLVYGKGSKETQEARLQALRRVLQNVLDAQDPMYVVNGTGEIGSMTNDSMEEEEEEEISLLDATKDLLENADDPLFVDLLMENTTDSGYTRIRNMVRRGKKLKEIREIVLSNIEGYMDMDAMEALLTEEEDDESTIYDTEMQNFIINLYTQIRGFDITHIRFFLEDFILDDDAEKIYAMIRNKSDLAEIQKALFIMAVSDYDLNEIRKYMVEGSTPIKNTNVDMQLVQYLLNDQYIPNQDENDSEEDDEDDDEEVVGEDFTESIHALQKEHPEISDQDAFNICSFIDVLLNVEDDVLDAVFSALLDEKDASNLHGIIQTNSRGDVLATFLALLLSDYDRNDWFKMLDDAEIELHPLKKNAIKIRIPRVEVTTDSTPKEEPKQNPNRIQFFADEKDDENSSDSETDILRAILSKELEEEEDPLTLEKDEFFNWMEKHVPGMDLDEVDEGLDKMSREEFHQFKNNIMKGIREGRIKMVDDDPNDMEEVPINLGRHTDVIRKMKGAKVSSHEEEEVSDEEVDAFCHKLLYGN